MIGMNECRGRYRTENLARVAHFVFSHVIYVYRDWGDRTFHLRTTRRDVGETIGDFVHSQLNDAGQNGFDLKIEVYDFLPPVTDKKTTFNLDFLLDNPPVIPAVLESPVFSI